MKNQKLQTLLNEYEAARAAIVPLKKKFDDFKTEIRNTIDRVPGVLRVRADDEFKDLVNALQVFEPGTTTRQRLDNIIERLNPVRANMKEAVARFMSAELALRDEVEPVWAEYCGQARKKKLALVKTVTDAIKPFCDSDYRANALAEETDQVKLASATVASLVSVIHPDMQARRVLSQP